MVKKKIKRFLPDFPGIVAVLSHRSSCLGAAFTPSIYLSLGSAFMKTATGVSRLTTLLKFVVAQPINYDPVLRQVGVTPARGKSAG